MGGQMKSNRLPIILILLGFIVAAVLITTAFQQTDALPANLAAAALKAQAVTATTTVVDQTRAGTTDGIVIMGFVIAVIVLVPVLFRKK